MGGVRGGRRARWRVQSFFGSGVQDFGGLSRAFSSLLAGGAGVDGAAQGVGGVDQLVLGELAEGHGAGQVDEDAGVTGGGLGGFGGGDGLLLGGLRLLVGEFGELAGQFQPALGVQRAAGADGFGHVAPGVGGELGVGGVVFVRRRPRT